MVVVLIIGILVAIALPTFLGARDKANEKAAQSGGRNTIAAAKTCFTDNDAYYGSVNGAAAAAICTSVALTNIETSLTFVANTASSDGPNKVSVLSDANGNFYLAVWSKSGKCFYAADNSSAAAVGGTGPGTKYASALIAAPGTGCTADAAKLAAPNGANW